MEPENEDVFSLERHKEQFEREIEQLVREYESEHKGPIEVDLSFVENEGSGPAPDDIRPRVKRLVDAFHSRPLIDKRGIRVHKVTAIDSDADGKIAVRVQYDYPGYPDRQ